MSLRIEVIGLEGIRRSCGQVAVGLETKAMQVANKKATESVIRIAMPLIPVASGQLRGSVRGLATAKKGDVRAGSAGVPYAAAIHWGRKTGSVWHHQRGRNVIKGRPYLWNAKDQALRSGQLQRDYLAACDELINNFF